MNRLAEETSPYLLQHKDNPVDWYPWGDEALARAREEGKPILVSIGYAACHWCHVMERESFEDPQVAALMNERFVCIKVDREERPDVDAIYMDAVQALTGRGGWPLNAFLTPDGAPFYAGTYFPPEPRHGMPAWPQVVVAVAEAFHTQRDEVDDTAQRLLPRLAGAASLEPAPGEFDPETLVRRGRRAALGLRLGARRLPEGRAEVPARLRDRVPARPRRARDGAAHAAGDGRRRHVRPDRRRLRPLLGRRAVGHPPLREDALRQRAARARLPARVPRVGRAAVRARDHGDARLGAARPAAGGGRVRVLARRGLRGRGGALLRLDARRDAGDRRRRGRRLLRARRPAQLRGQLGAGACRARPRGAGGDQARAARGARAARLAGARRQAAHLLERADDLGAGRRGRRARAAGLRRGRGGLRGVRAGATCATRRAACCGPTTAAARSSAPTSRTTRSCSRRCSRCTAPRSTRAGSRRRASSRRRSSPASPTRSTAASTRPPTTTSRWSPGARSSRTRRSRPARRARRPACCGWPRSPASTATRRPPRACCGSCTASRRSTRARSGTCCRRSTSTSPPVKEVAIVGPGAEPLERVARGAFRPHVVLAGGAADGVPLLEGRDPVDGRAAAYVCERFACRRPVTTPDELAGLLG